MIDSHCHLDHEPLLENIDEVIKRSKAVGIKKILTICTTLNSFIKIKEIVKKDEIIFGTFGIHPHEVIDNKVSSEKIIREIKYDKKIIGIGETGLDYYYTHSEPGIQKKSFINHINAAHKLNIPLVVHSRNAEKDTYEILKSEIKNYEKKIIIHCFTGTKDFAKKLLDIGCYISISGIITFKNSNELTDTVSNIPLEKLLVETDAPYLAPVPYRGKPNEPSYINHTVNKIAEIKKVTKEILEEKTTNNFKGLFNIT